MQGQFEHAIRRVIDHLIVGSNRPNSGMCRTSRAYDELADAVSRVEAPAWRLRGKTLVEMRVPVQDHVGTGVIQDLPERPDARRFERA